MYIVSSVTSIGYSAFGYCSGLTDIYYNGSKKDWKAIEKYSGWDDWTGNYTVHCSDGDLSKE